MGSPIVRCVIAGSRAALPKGPADPVIEYVLRVVKQVRTQLASSGLRIAFEIHKDLQAWEYRQLIEAAGPALVGTYLDTGNPIFVMEDPMTTLEELGRYALTVHLRDSVVYETRHGIAVQWVPLGEGIIDFKAFLRRLREITTAVHNDVSVYVKPITGRPPEILPVYDREFWARFRRRARPIWQNSSRWLNAASPTISRWWWKTWRAGHTRLSVERHSTPAAGPCPTQSRLRA